jgi:hypothetical protein
MKARQTVGVITLEPSAENDPWLDDDSTLESTFHRLVSIRNFDCHDAGVDRIGIRRIFEQVEEPLSESVVYADVHELTNELAEEFDLLRQYIDL